MLLVSAAVFVEYFTILDVLGCVNVDDSICFWVPEYDSCPWVAEISVYAFVESVYVIEPVVESVYVVECVVESVYVVESVVESMYIVESVYLVGYSVIVVYEVVGSGVVKHGAVIFTEKIK